MIIVFTGNGKGKTTAALGQVMRVVGRGKKALMIQFIKGPWISGEDKLVQKLARAKSTAPAELATLHEFDIKKMGLGFVGILGDTLPREEHERAAGEALEYFKQEKQSGAWDLLVLDEVNVAVDLRLLTAAQVLEAIRDFPEDKILVLTGRNAPQEFIAIANLATEMREIKHPFANGQGAKITVEF